MRTMSATGTMSKRAGDRLSVSRRVIWLLPLLLCTALGPLQAQLSFQPDVIFVSDVTARDESVSMKFKGTLQGYPGVYIVEVHRSPNAKDPEWNALVQHLQKHVRKTVSIVIRAQARASRGGTLTLFEKPEIRLQEVR